MILLTHVFKSLLFFIVLLGLLLGVLDYTDVSFKSEKARQVVLQNIKTYTGRDVSIDGDVYLTISLSPKLLVEQMHIRNIEGYESEDFISVAEARIEVALLPLLSGTFRLEELSADSAEINLIQNKDGSNNWSFDHVTSTTDTVSEEQKKDLNKKRKTKRLSIGIFSLTDVVFRYMDRANDQLTTNHFERVLLDVKDINKPKAVIRGNLQGNSYSLSFESDPFHTLTSGQPWTVHGTGEVAGSKTDIETTFQTIEGSLSGILDIRVKNINLGSLFEKLGVIAGQDAATENASIKIRLRGSNLTELYQQAEIELQLRQGYWKLTSPDTIYKKELSFDKIESRISWNKPVEFHLDGKIADETITLDFRTDTLQEFFDDNHELNVDLRSSIAGIKNTIKGTLDLPIKGRQFQLGITLKGKNLEKLNPILDIKLPPFNDFSLTGKLLANKNRITLRSAEASIGDSHFNISIDLDTALAKPLWTVSIDSNKLQLKDFSLDDLKPNMPDTTEPGPSKQATKPALIPFVRLEKAVRSTYTDLKLNLKVDKILSGKDVLGKAKFQLNLTHNKISLQNAVLEIPGGRITTSFLLEVDDSYASGEMLLNISKFDYGIAARLLSPGSKKDGIVSIRLDLQLGGGDFTHLLDHATGKIDIALWPRNVDQIKILDLWATNLYFILLPELNKKESKVNCLVGLMDMKNGVMKEDFFAIDTTKLWIQGNFNVDFEKKDIELALFPRSKTARLFSIQAPIRAQGKFSDINLVTNSPVELAVTYISFITSPLHVPARWIFEDKPPENGSAVCEQFFDREYVENLKKELEKKEREEIENDDLFDDDF